MDQLFTVDWAEMFLPSHSLLDIAIRGTFMYLSLFLMLRFFLKRQTGEVGIADFLVIVLIADAAQNAMAAEYKSVTEGIVLVGTIIFWNMAVDWLGYTFPRLRWLTRPQPLLLVRDGRLNRRNMRKEFVTEEELMSQIRQHGLSSLGDVKAAYIEGDGRVSLVKKGE
ncbi:YetF domain-containing protein [Azospirillum sp. SYSU D00513]|uniref:DUF421 domain-containing protein n=1 Tax=Azospirillum sp. SYSU D00513 TaxID=2812561 RepID=UPI001A9715A3|nr:YetF domain-containing protein [Azospirillum sp. SYSU D00513]